MAHDALAHALAHLNDALDEQRVEVALFRHQLAILKSEFGEMSAGVDRFGANMDKVQRDIQAANQVSRKTCAL